MKFTTPYEGNFGNNPKKTVFYNSGELKKWAQEELDFWTELLDEYKNGSLGDLVRQISTQQLSPSQQVVNLLTQEPLPEESQLLQQLENPLSAYSDDRVTHSNSKNGKLFSGIFKKASSESEIRKAIFFLGFLNKHNFDFNNPEIRNTHVRDFLTSVAVNLPKIEKNGLTSEAEKEALEALRTDWNEKLLEHEGLHALAVENIEEKKTDITETAEAQKEEFDTFMSQTDKSFKDLKKFYEEDLRTEAPVTYWSDKAKRHRIYQIVSGVVFVLGIIGAIWFSYSTGLSVNELLVTPEPEEIPVAQSVDVQATTSTTTVLAAELNNEDSSSLAAGLTVRVLELVIPFFLIVWLLRIVVKMFLLNSALADDAEERVTMIMTFRSLLEHEEKMDSQDRILMLNALFRPTNAHGDDDGAPPNWFDVLVQRINK